MRNSAGIRLLAAALVALFALTARVAVSDEAKSVQRAIVPAAIQDFELIDQQGRPRRFSDFQGAPVLIFFGFTHCPEVCPTTLHELKILKQSSDREIRRVQVVFISVDGDRDTPARLKSYLEPISKSFVGLTGPPKTVRGVAAQFSSVFVKGVREKDGSYQVQHTSQIYLVDASGKLRATFFNATQDEMRTAIAQIRG
ncbi:MAG TPA: SCO family protein [Povalibacter sp.]